MKCILNLNYVLRKDGHNTFYLYNKVCLTTYYITYKLYVFLSLFRKSAIDLNEVLCSFEKEGFETNDIMEFLQKTEFNDVLVPVKKEILLFEDYLKPKGLSSITAPSPQRVDFFITKHCNLACKHCFEGASPKFSIRQLSRNEIMHFLAQLNGADIKTLKITGGEPFTHPAIDDIIELLPRCNFETMILTNALLLTDERIIALKKAHVQLGISLDGISADTYDYIRGHGCFKRLTSVLKKLSQNNIKFSLTCTVNAVNIKELDKLIEYVLDNLHAESLFLNRLRPIGRGNEIQSLALSEEENSYVVSLYLKMKEQYGMRIILSDDAFIDENISQKDNSVSCAAGNTIIAVDENFDVYPCIYAVGHKEYIMGNLQTSNVGDVWGKKKWDIFRGKLKVEQLKDCVDCALNDVCKIKNCRLKPVFEGRSFLSSVSYCKGNVDLKQKSYE